MVRRHVASLRLALMAADGLSALVVFLLVSIVRFGSDNWKAPWRAAGVDASLLGIAYACMWVTILWLFGLYRLRARWAVRTEIVDVVRAVFVLALVTFVALFWLKLPNVSRTFLLLLFPTQLVLTVASRWVLRWAFAVTRQRGLNARFMLVVGTGPEAVAFADRVEARHELGLRVIGYLAERPAEADDQADGWRIGEIGRPILGGLDDIQTLLHTRVVDEVAICLPTSRLSFVEPITRLCEDEGRIVRIPTGDSGLTLPGARIEIFDGIRVMSLVYGPDRAVALLGKRLLDLALAAVGLLVLSPLFAVTALALLASEGRPVLFRQVRVGLHGRPFSIVKFRTMTADAEARYDDVVSLSDTRGAAFKMTNDPRITRIGRLLRKTSIDELPQLWNVLRGQMSIVGPRPAPPREVDAYDVWHRRRLSMKPGITGLWQVEARFDEEFDHRAALDLRYIDRWSIWLDLRIMARTIPAIVANPGR